MVLAGFRIDDRLLHGQVVENWLQELRPARVVVASDRAAGDPLVCELFQAAMPGDVELVVSALAGAPAAVAGSPGPVYLIVGSAMDALTLSRDSGIPARTIVVGGLHEEGGRQLTDFVFASCGELSALASLARDGATLIAQDVPRRRPVDLTNLLGPLPEDARPPQPEGS